MRALGCLRLSPFFLTNSKEMWTMRASTILPHFTLYTARLCRAPARPDSSWFAASLSTPSARKAFLGLLDSLSLPLRRGRVFLVPPMAVQPLRFPPLLCSCPVRPFRFHWAFCVYYSQLYMSRTLPSLTFFPFALIVRGRTSLSLGFFWVLLSTFLLVPGDYLRPFKITSISTFYLSPILSITQINHFPLNSISSTQRVLLDNPLSELIC